jgi:outer membrane biosynthesis protein TonB
MTDPSMGHHGGHGPDQDPGEFRAYVRQRNEGARKRSGTGLAIVAAGVAVFGGVVWYAYSQGNRAGTESVAPVLQADTSPTRIKPEQPGGIEVPHQDKLVYGRLNPNAKEPGVEHLLPPPEEPLARPKPGARKPATAEADLPEEKVPPPGSVPAPAPAPAAAADAAKPAVAEAAKPAPVAPPAPQPAPQPAAQPAAPPAPQVAAVAPPATGGGVVRLQLASVGQEPLAAGEWQRLSRKYPDLLGGVGYRVVAADLGAKGTFYRVQAGPVDEARAREICDALKAKGDGCIVVR